MSNLYSTKKVVQNFHWSFLGGASSGVLAFIGSVFVARYLDVTSYGTLQLATTYFLFMQLLENFAHPNILKIEMLNSPEKQKDFIVASGQMVLFFYLLALALLSVVYLLFPSETLLFTILMTAGQLLRFGVGLSCYFDARLDSYKNQISIVTGNLVSNIYRILAAFTGRTSLQALNIIIGNFAALIVMLYFYKCSQLRLNFFQPKVKSIIFIFKQSVPMIFIALVTMAVFKVDVLLLGFFNMKDQISFYSNAVKFAEPWNFVATGVVSALLPNIISGKKQSIKLYYRNLRRMFSILFACSFVIGIFFSVFADVLIQATYGAKYLDSIPMLRVHIWSNIFLFYMIGLQVWEINEKMKQFLFYKLLIGLAVNIALNYILIPKYGGLGCAVASVFTYFVVSVGLNFFNKKARFFNKQIWHSILEVPEIGRSLSKILLSKKE